MVSGRELNLVHKTLLTEEEIDDPEARSEVSRHAVDRVQGDITQDNQRLLKSEVGARAIMDLSRWYSKQWQLAIGKPLIYETIRNSPKLPFVLFL